MNIDQAINLIANDVQNRTNWACLKHILASDDVKKRCHTFDLVCVHKDNLRVLVGSSLSWPLFYAWKRLSSVQGIVRLHWGYPVPFSLYRRRLYSFLPLLLPARLLFFRNFSNLLLLPSRRVQFDSARTETSERALAFNRGWWRYIAWQVGNRDLTCAFFSWNRTKRIFWAFSQIRLIQVFFTIHYMDHNLINFSHIYTTKIKFCRSH